MALPATLSETLAAVTQAEVFHMDVRRDASGGPVVTVTYNVKRQSDGAIRQQGRSLQLTLTNPQKTTLADFITNVAVPQINANHAG